MKKAKVATRAKSPRRLKTPVAQATSRFLSDQEQRMMVQTKRARQNADAQHKLEVPEFAKQAKEAAKSLHKLFMKSERLMQDAATLVSQKPLTKVDRNLYRAPAKNLDPSVFTRRKAWNLGRTGDADTTFVYLDEDGDIHVITYITFAYGNGGTKTFVKEMLLSAHVIEPLNYSVLNDIIQLIELNRKTFISL